MELAHGLFSSSYLGSFITLWYSFGGPMFPLVLLYLGADVRF